MSFPFATNKGPCDLTDFSRTHSGLVLDQTRKGGFRVRNVEEVVLDTRERDGSAEAGAAAGGSVDHEKDEKDETKGSVEEVERTDPPTLVRVVA